MLPTEMPIPPNGSLGRQIEVEISRILISGARADSGRLTGYAVGRAASSRGIPAGECGDRRGRRPGASNGSKGVRATDGDPLQITLNESKLHSNIARKVARR